VGGDVGSVGSSPRIADETGCPDSRRGTGVGSSPRIADETGGPDSRRGTGVGERPVDTDISRGN
jgi:hypothetical protein